MTLKNLRRATIVGDTTGGGPYPWTLRINDRFAAFVPVGRAINPITSTNWEGVGVAPDSVVAAHRALPVAQWMAFRQLKALPGTDPDWQGPLTGLMAEQAQQAARYVRQPFVLNGYANARVVQVAGSFNDWSPEGTRLVRKGNAWVGEVEVEPGKISYKFVVDGQWMTDPANARTETDGQHTNSVMHVAAP